MSELDPQKGLLRAELSPSGFLFSLTWSCSYLFSSCFPRCRQQRFRTLLHHVRRALSNTIAARETTDTTNNHNEEFKQRRAAVLLWLSNKSKPRRACWPEQKGFEAQTTISHRGWGAWIWRGERGRGLSPGRQTVGWAQEGARQVSQAFAPKEIVVLGHRVARALLLSHLLIVWVEGFQNSEESYWACFLELWVRHKRQGVWRMWALTCRRCHILSWYTL